MILEHEVIEQIEEDEDGWPLETVCELIRRLGRDDPMAVLHGMWRGGYIVVADERAQRLADWQHVTLFRDDEVRSGLRVLATDRGSDCYRSTRSRVTFVRRSSNG